jgi:hypothetical protein
MTHCLPSLAILELLFLIKFLQHSLGVGDDITQKAYMGIPHSESVILVFLNVKPRQAHLALQIVIRLYLPSVSLEGYVDAYLSGPTCMICNILIYIISILYPY